MSWCKTVLHNAVLASSLVFLSSPVVSTAGGLAISDTRLILEDGQTSGALVLRNTTPNQFLTKCWITELNGTPTENIIAAPPVAFSPPNKYIRFQVVVLRPEELPSDRESIFRFHTHSVPLKSDAKNTLEISYDMQVKVFYRPKGLEGNMTEAIEDLQWSLKKGTLTATNNSKYNISLVTYGVEKDFQGLKNFVLAPESSASFKLKKTYLDRVQIRWAAIDDYGSPVRRSTVITNEK